MKSILATLFTTFFILGSNSLLSQATIQFRILSVYTNLDDMDVFANSSDPVWCYEVRDNSFLLLGQGSTQYSGQDCLGTANPLDAFFSESYDCSAPTSYNFRWRARENDNPTLAPGNIFSTDGEALTTLQSVFIPAASINLPQGGWSTLGTYTAFAAGDNCTGGGTVTWRITLQYRTSFTSWPGNGNDLICNAVDLGTLNNGATIGNNGLSNYSNFCAGTAGDPNPWGGNNDQGVWFKFTTDGSPASEINIEGVSDPQSFGDAVDLQLALYESSNGLCNGALSLVQEDYDIAIWDETMSVSCLKPNTTYYILVDGETTLINGGQEGYFGLQISDNGVTQAGDEICDAEDLGTVPASGSVGTALLSQTNSCATNTNDPIPSAWGSDQTVWYKFQAPPSGSVIIDANSDLPFPLGTNALDIQLAVYGSDNNFCSGTITEIFSDYNPPLYDENLTVKCLTPGDNYWVMLDGSALDVNGIFDITITDAAITPATNNAICDAIALGAPAPGGTVGVTNQNNYCADNLFEPIPSNWGNDQGVWYTFIAPPSGKIEVQLSTNILLDAINLQVAVYDLSGMLCTGIPTELASEHDGLGLILDEDMTVSCLVPGSTYWILVDGEGSLIDPELVEGIFDIAVYGDPQDAPLTNDTPCTAIALGDPSGSSVGTTPGALHGSQNNFCSDAIGEPTPASFIPNQTVWYTFVAPLSGTVDITLTSDLIIGGVDPINLQMAIYESTTCTGAWTELYSGQGLTYDLATVLSCLVPGQTYYIQVDGELPVLLESHEGYFDINISDVYPTYGTGAGGDPEPANNDCADAITLTVQSESCSNGSGTFDLLNYGIPTNTYDPAFVQACGSNCGDTWYQFTLPSSGSVIIEGEDDGVGVGVDFSTTNIVVYSGTCGSLTAIGCEKGGSGNDVFTAVSGVPGATIWVQVFNEGGADNSEDYQICVFEGCGFDDCIGATLNPLLKNVPGCFNTAIATGENISGGDSGYEECFENDNTENSIYCTFTTDLVGGDVTIIIDNVQINGSCNLGVPSDGFNVSIYEDNTPCDNNATSLLDCQDFDACDVLPINFVQTYPGLPPNTTYVIVIDGGLGATGGNTQGVITVSGAIPLYVELISFYGEKLNRTNKLYWESAIEQNNDYYSLERSSDGENYELIEDINGAGTTLSPTSYEFIDYTPLNGVTYYRLSQTDFDGKQSFLKTITLNNSINNFNMTIVPNPVNDFPLLLIENQVEGMGEINVVDAAGRIIQYQSRNLTKGSNSITLNTQSLLSGVYFIQLRTERGLETIRFVKNK